LLALPGNLRQGVIVGRAGIERHAETITKQSIRAVGAVASKKLVNSVTSTSSLQGKDKSVTKCGTREPQGYWIEHRRKPGKVPAWPTFKEILRKWAASKGLTFSDSALWFIAKKIRAQGYQAREPFKKAALAMGAGARNILKVSLGGKIGK
jgi:hypothetical protein